MLRLNHISLLQFKNYLNHSFDFNQRIIGISGKNGVGKTNLLDAIYYLCFTKGYFSKQDQANVQRGRSGFRIAGDFELSGEEVKAICILRENGKKEFLWNNEPYEKFADHIGKFPAVFVAPDDVHIITEGSEERRRYIDALLSQLEHEYLIRLMEYNRVLQHRNGLLKSFAERKSVDHSLLEVVNDQLIKPGEYIFQQRKMFLSELIPLIKQFYQQISGETYEIEVNYVSQLQEKRFQQLLERNEEKDLILQRTSAGIHRDDLEFALYESSFKAIASQGQRKSLLFALKLGEFTSLKNHKGFSPLLLLDDVFEKLDEFRMNNLLEFVCCQNDGQVFLTDTHSERLNHALDVINQEGQIIQLEN
jgi:DNA replication and repair protein RecF